MSVTSNINANLPLDINDIICVENGNINITGRFRFSFCKHDNQCHTVTNCKCVCVCVCVCDDDLFFFSPSQVTLIMQPC